MIRDILLDLEAVKRNKWVTFFGNRGFHALVVYRISHALWKLRIPGIPMLLTRLIHILYAIEIDYHARLEGGINIIHGFATVIGPVEIKRGATIFHGVTIGRNFSGRQRDGNPRIEAGVFIGAGAKILGPITVGAGAKIGANAVILEDVPPGETVTQRKLLKQLVREELAKAAALA